MLIILRYKTISIRRYTFTIAISRNIYIRILSIFPIKIGIVENSCRFNDSGLWRKIIDWLPLGEDFLGFSNFFISEIIDSKIQVSS